MPFITQEARQRLAENPKDWREVGDICYLAYSRLVVEWEKEPRWATQHRLRKSLGRWLSDLYPPPKGFTHEDVKESVQAAWEVFFIDHVMPYERRKKVENGDITSLAEARTDWAGKPEGREWAGESQGGE